MKKNIELVFHNNGLRSYIELDLCAECPRQDDKGCCGFYSPVFYPCDFAYLLKNDPDVLDYIFNLKNLTILDASVTANNHPDGSSYRCSFHRKEGGCLLPQVSRESICRHFICPGIAWEKESKLKHWHRFFTELADCEIALNNEIAAALKEKGLTLRNEDNRKEFFDELLILFDAKTRNLPSFLAEYPQSEKANLVCEVKYGMEWPL